jgi:hypothetical protein
MRRAVSLLFSLLTLLVLAAPTGAQSPQVAPWQLTSIPAPDPRFGLFGSAVALSGDTLAVAGVEKTLRTVVLYVYVRDGNEWSRQAAFTIGNPHESNVPAAIALSGDTLAVGLAHQDVGTTTEAGAVHVFVRRNGVWTRQARLVSSDQIFEELFGYSVAVSGDTIAVGAIVARDAQGGIPGAVYVFRRSGGRWAQTARLQPRALHSGAHFGIWVSLSGDRLAVGAHFDATDPGGATSGSAWVFARQGEAWVQEARLIGEPGVTQYGETVSLSGDDLGVGAFPDRAYVYHRSGGAWVLQARLTVGDDPQAGIFFGFAIAVGGNLAVVEGVRRPAAPGVPEALGAYLFRRRPDGVWVRRGLLDPALRQYGLALDIEGNVIALGSARTPDSGEVHVYRPITGNP